jgi:toxin-antitoxin system PIN domain toxin
VKVLLDVNVLLALAWPNHQFHGAAVAWFDARPQAEWGTCALTELAFMRLSCNPAFTPDAKSPAQALRLLHALETDSRHFHIATQPSLSGKGFHGVFERVLGHKQIMDAYLLGLAARSRLKLLSFDRRLAALQADGATLELIPV